MRVDILAGTQCDACGSWEFECRGEEFFCADCQLPARGMEVEATHVEGEKSAATVH